jgi:hypothetical protein
MKEKKVLGVLFLGLILSSFFLSFVSAYGGYYNPRQGMGDLINIAVDFFQPLLQVLLGGENWTGYLLFEKLILFILIAALVYVAIAKVGFFDNNKAVIWIITLAVPLLGVRWMDFEWLNYIIVQYQVIGVVLTVMLPFIIYLFFVHGVSHSSSFRRIAWAFYLAIYYGIWTTSPTTGLVDNAYVWTMLVAVGLIIFDPIIHKLMTKDQDLAPLRASLINSIAQLDQQLQAITPPNAPHLSQNQRDKTKKYLEKQILKLQKELGKL